MRGRGPRAENGGVCRRARRVPKTGASATALVWACAALLSIACTRGATADGERTYEQPEPAHGGAPSAGNAVAPDEAAPAEVAPAEKATAEAKSDTPLKETLPEFESAADEGVNAAKPQPGGEAEPVAAVAQRPQAVSPGNDDFIFDPPAKPAQGGAPSTEPASPYTGRNHATSTNQPPECGAPGTRGSRWSTQDGRFIRWGCKKWERPVCRKQGAKGAGWYVNGEFLIAGDC